MINPRQRFLVWAAAVIAGIWLLAWAGHRYFESLKVTAAKVSAYAGSVDFGQLAGEARARALKELEVKVNALTYEERQRFRGDRLMDDWFAKMTEEEKAQFIEATLPTGFKQMISAFEQLPDDKRHKMLDDAMKNIRESGGGAARGGMAGRPPISPELEAKIRNIGLNAFYSHSSAQTKAELAPLLEELQRQMESGRMLHRP